MQKQKIRIEATLPAGSRLEPNTIKFLLERVTILQNITVTEDINNSEAEAVLSSSKLESLIAWYNRNKMKAIFDHIEVIKNNPRSEFFIRECDMEELRQILEIKKESKY